jgi:two-component system, NarL family, nitrate/nitrite response regulator NarL
VTTAGAPIRVVLVEDSDVYRDSLVYLLGTRGDLAIVAAVGDGAAGVRAYREHAPDVVVLDYRLPDVDGAAVAADLGDGAAIVFLSASAGQDEYDAASSAAAALVRKDEGIDVLVRAIRTAAGR